MRAGAAGERDGLLAGRSEARVRRAAVQIPLPNHKIHRKQISGLIERRRIPKDPIVAAVNHVQISTLVDSNADGLEKSGAQVRSRALIGRRQKIALADHFVREVALGETKCILPCQHPVIARVGDVQNRRASRSVDCDGLGIVEFPALH